MSSAEITTPDVSAPSVAAPSELRTVLRQNWWRLSLTYALFNIENVLRLAQPLLLGWAINGLLHSSLEGVIAFATGHVLHMLIRTWRQMFDTRTFTRIHAGRAGRLVVRLASSLTEAAKNETALRRAAGLSALRYLLIALQFTLVARALGLEGLARGEGVPAADLVPRYLRRSSAEVQRSISQRA